MSKLILAIDDEECIRAAFKLALEDLDYEVVTAVSGEEGWKLAELRRPDLVFIDLKMPGIGGVETVRRLLCRYRDLPVYVVTAFYEEYMEYLDTVQAEGLSFEIIRKPIGAEKIRMVVASVFEGPQSNLNGQES